MKPILIRKYTNMKFSIADADKSGSIELREFLPLFHGFINDYNISLTDELLTEIEGERELPLGELEASQSSKEEPEKPETNEDLDIVLNPFPVSDLKRMFSLQNKMTIDI